jgi:hypothetical protein
MQEDRLNESRIHPGLVDKLRKNRARHPAGIAEELEKVGTDQAVLQNEQRADADARQLEGNGRGRRVESVIFRSIENATIKRWSMQR